MYIETIKNTLKFGTLEKGDCFMWLNCLMMKITNVCDNNGYVVANCINLKTNNLALWQENTEVEIVNAKIVVEK